VRAATPQFDGGKARVISTSVSVALYREEVVGRKREAIKIGQEFAPAGEDDFLTVHKGNARDRAKCFRIILLQDLRQFDDGQFAFAVNDNIDQAGGQDMGSYVGEETSTRHNAGSQFFRKPREPKSLDATHRLFSNSDVVRL
jgi:hypothetical protein